MRTIVKVSDLVCRNAFVSLLFNLIAYSLSAVVEGWILMNWRPLAIICIIRVTNLSFKVFSQGKFYLLGIRTSACSDHICWFPWLLGSHIWARCCGSLWCTWRHNLSSQSVAAIRLFLSLYMTGLLWMKHHCHPINLMIRGWWALRN